MRATRERADGAVGVRLFFSRAHAAGGHRAPAAAQAKVAQRRVAFLGTTRRDKMVGGLECGMPGRQDLRISSLSVQEKKKDVRDAKKNNNNNKIQRKQFRLAVRLVSMHVL
jgi:hypothetical protein